MIFMTIQIPNPGTGVPADETGDSPWLAMQKVADNFSNQTHAASRLVGGEAGNLMQVGAFGLGVMGNPTYSAATKLTDMPNGFFQYEGNKATNDNIPPAMGDNANYGFKITGTNANHAAALFLPYYIADTAIVIRTSYLGGSYLDYVLWHNQNATKDPNGFLKTSSPIAEIYSDKMDLNSDAQKQDITFEKLSAGNYLVKGSLGFAQEGWHIETPKDANGNVLVAVVSQQLANNDLSIKTYAKKFDDETGDIVPNLLKPRDIPAGRFISLRLHELPVEPPVMPDVDLDKED